MLKLLAKGVSFMRQTLRNDLSNSESEADIFADLPSELIHGEMEEKTFYGQVTSLHDGYGLVDGHVYFGFDVVVGGFRPKVGCQVRVKAVRGDGEEWRAVCLSEVREDWEDDSEREVHLQIDTEGVVPNSFVGVVSYVEQTWGLINNEERFEFNVFEGDFSLMCGDWVEVMVLFSQIDNRQEIIKVTPLRRKQIAGRISFLNADYGLIDNEVYFPRGILNVDVHFKRGDDVYAETIESTFKHYSWRATHIIPVSITNGFTKSKPASANFNNSPSHELFKNKNNITVTTPLNFGAITLGESENKTLKIVISNDGQDNQTLLSHQLLSTANEQFTCCPTQPDSFDKPVVIQPGGTIDFIAECFPRILGHSSQLVVFNFIGFAIGRLLTVNVQDQQQKLICSKESFKNTSNAPSKSLPCSVRLNEASWVVPGQKRFTKSVFSRNFGSLPQCKVPKELWDCVMNKRDLMLLEPCLIKPLNMEYYKNKLHTLMHVEEIQMECDMEQFSMEDVVLVRHEDFLVLDVPGLPDGRPSLIIGDTVVVNYTNTNAGTHYEGCIHDINETLINLKFHPKFHENYNDEPLCVIFKFNRTTLRRCHQAIQLSDILGADILFPGANLFEGSTFRNRCNCKSQELSITNDESKGSPNKKKRQTVVDRLFNENASLSKKEPKESECHCDGIKYFNPRLNERQKLAVQRILSGPMKSTPHIIFGPPGTGKSVTVVEAVLQVLHLHKHSRVLLCAPSNSAADLLTERLHLSGGLLPGWMVRVIAFQRLLSNIPECIHEYCSRCDNLPVLVRHKVVICTCSTSGVFHSLNLPLGHFTHVFVDEAGQATEPECLIPLLHVGHVGQIILAGDPEQLGPVIHSRFAISCGLNVSFLERLMQLPLYSRDVEKFPQDSYNPIVVTKLINNYRSHPALLHLPSTLFYHNELLAKGDHAIYSQFCQTSILPHKDFPIIFHGIQGENLREGNNLSWFNAVEVMQVLRYVKMLHELKISCDDIGIVTPYRKQVEKIRFMLESLDMGKPKVGSTEEFQGQERLVIIISTVRSCEDQLEAFSNLGFVGNKKRFNVSITRAQALLIIIGNPFVLSTDPNWKQLLFYCIKNGSYIGCDLPNFKLEE